MKLQEMSPLLRQMLFLALSNGLLCVGGFPLWLMGGADSYGDIDLYCPTDYHWQFWTAYFHKVGIEMAGTPNSRTFLFHGETIQLVTPPWPEDYRWMLQHTDLSASAVALTLEENEFCVYAEYPDDIANRQCRILEVHEWTPYRVSTYQAKGYKFVL